MVNSFMTHHAMAVMTAMTDTTANTINITSK
jgi:hypothetical protein